MKNEFTYFPLKGSVSPHHHKVFAYRGGLFDYWNNVFTLQYEVPWNDYCWLNWICLCLAFHVYRVTRKPSWIHCGLLFSLFFQMYVCWCVCVCLCMCNALIAWRTTRLPAGSKRTRSEKRKWQRMKRVSMKEIKCRKERFKGLVHPMGKTWKVCLKADGLPEEDDKEKVRGERQKRHWWQISKDRLGTIGLERWN